MTRKLTRITLAILTALAITAAVAAADGPIVWKNHCPRHHDVITVPDSGGDGVHILCIRAADEAVR